MIIRTVFSTYLLDPQARTVTRLSTGEGHKLRRDGEPIHLYGWTEPAVGREMMLLVQVREDGMKTARRTSYVMSVEE